MTAPYVSGTPTHAVGTATSLAVNKPSGVVAGDWVALMVQHYNISTSAPSCPGFICPVYGGQTNTTVWASAAILFKQLDGSEGSTFTLTTNAPATYIDLTAIPIRGARGINHPTAYRDSGNAFIGTFELPAIDVPMPDSLVLMSWTAWNDPITGGYTGWTVDTNEAWALNFYRAESQPRRIPITSMTSTDTDYWAVVGASLYGDTPLPTQQQWSSGLGLR